MNVCKSCGNLLDSPQTAVCSACAIGNVLQGDWDYVRPSPSSRSQPVSPLFKQIPVREDFFEKYQILEAIDDGGQGQVWKIWDYKFRRVLAMKGLDEELIADDSACYRFLAEAQITSQLKHPGILPVYDVGLDFEGKPFYTTDLCNGFRLDHHWSKLRKERGARAALKESLELLVRVCDIMGHVHSRGVIHRDLKPSNILIGEFGDVRIVDWGSAAILKNGDSTFAEPFIGLEPSCVQTGRQEILTQKPNLATSLGGWPSTVVFTPPELLAGSKNQAGPETDVYALGVILYELLTGRLPYLMRDSEPDEDLKLRILLHPPAAILTTNPTASRDLVAIAERAMAREKRLRYHSMQELAEDIRAALELRPVKARNPNAVLKTQRFLQRHSAIAVLATLVVGVGVISFATVRVFQAQKRASQQVEALESAELARRSGHWPEVLRDLNEAERAGYRDAIALGLKRAEAWTVLNQPNQSKAELERLANTTGKLRGLVRLRMGEHDLYDAQTAAKGIDLVTQALKLELDPADEAFANGLLAKNATQALDLFRHALSLDPYHYGAHIQSLSLDYLLGLRTDLESESRVFRALYPDDPSPIFLEAFNAAADGRMKDVHSTLQVLKDRISPELLTRAEKLCEKMNAMARSFKNDHLIDSEQASASAISFSILPPVASSGSDGLADTLTPLRMPYLPCVVKGSAEAFTAVRSLSIPMVSAPLESFQRIESAHLLYGEALAPFWGGILLKKESRSKAGNGKLSAMAGELFELAANSSSVFPVVPRLARFMAAQTEFDLVKNADGMGAKAAETCLRNVAKASAQGGCSARELSGYFEFSFALKDYDLARAILVQWEGLEPANQTVWQNRIELEIAVGALTEARTRLEHFLARNPTDAWALKQRAVIH